MILCGPCLRDRRDLSGWVRVVLRIVGRVLECGNCGRRG